METKIYHILKGQVAAQEVALPVEVTGFQTDFWGYKHRILEPAGDPILPAITHPDWGRQGRLDGGISFITKRECIPGKLEEMFADLATGINIGILNTVAKTVKPHSVFNPERVEATPGWVIEKTASIVNEGEFLNKTDPTLQMAFRVDLIPPESPILRLTNTS